MSRWCASHAIWGFMSTAIFCRRHSKISSNAVHHDNLLFTISTLIVPNHNTIHIRYTVATTLTSCTVSSSAAPGLRLWRSAIPFVVFRRANPLGRSCRRHHRRRLHRQWLHPAKKKFPRRLIIGSKNPLKFILQILLIAWRQNSISPKPKAN